MKYVILVILGGALFFAADLLGARSLSDAPLALWPWEEPGAATRTAVGIAAFAGSALLVGMFFSLCLGTKKRRRKYPSSLGELDEYTDYLP